LTTYHVRLKCQTESDLEGHAVYKRTEQVDEVDPDWIPDGCEGHVLKDFCIEEITEP